MKKQKFYVVWRGRATGVFDSWKETDKLIKGFDGALYKSFESKAEAEKAFAQRPEIFIGKAANIQQKNQKIAFSGKPIDESLAVDAAWNTATGVVEYQGVYNQNKQLIFRQGPFNDGTNNIGEFLAVVHALALLKKQGSNMPVYSDSRTAIAWVRNRKAKTTIEKTPRNQPLFDLLDRAERWLEENTYENNVLKWETKAWGENPADFGRK